MSLTAGTQPGTAAATPSAARHASTSESSPAAAVRVSAIVLTFNEERRIESCLESLTWADEIIVVDGFSTDSTCDLARRFTAHVYQSDLLGPKNPGGFSDQRNFAVSKATGDWLLFVDADERVTPELAAEIRRVTASTASADHAAYAMGRHEHFFGVLSPYTHGDGAQTRLLRRGRARWDGRLVHEGVVFEGLLGKLEHKLLHFSKDSVVDYVTTMNRYTTLEAQEAFKAGQPLARSPLPQMLRNFAHRYWHMGSYREGRFGLLMSVMFAVYAYLTWAKLWEFKVKAGEIPGQTKPSALTGSVGALIRGVWHATGSVKQSAKRLIGRGGKS